MFRFVRKALEDMGVPQRRFRHDVVNNPADISTLPGYPKGTEEKTFRITVVRGIHEDVIDARASESVAVALERSAIPVDTHCRNGECGFCRSQLLGGDIFGSKRFRRQIGYFILLCVLAIIYISNRYAYQREEIRREDLSKQLNDRKFKALTISSELTEYSMRSSVEENLSDTTLRTSTKSSYYLPVDSVEED